MSGQTLTGQPVRRRRHTPVESVAVVLLTHPGGPVLRAAVESLASQTRLPDRIVVHGLASSSEEVLEARRLPAVRNGQLPLSVREDPALEGSALEGAPLDGAEPHIGRVLLDAVEDLPAGSGAWVWLLHDDSDPDPTALEELVAATRRTPDAAIVGPKIVSALDPRRLVAVGQRVTRSGRLAEPGMAGQLDQGQFDERTDVLAVPLTGMLVRADVLAELGGLDPAFDDAGSAGLDLSWRSHLAGHRVVVAPAAVLRQGPAGVAADHATTRRRARQVALARGALLPSLLRAVVLLVTGLLLGPALFLLKRPTQAARAFADVGAVLAPWRAWGARWRFRGRRAVRHADLDGLFASPREARRATRDADRLPAPLRTATDADRATAVETGPVADEALSLDSGGARRAWWSWPAAATFLLATAAAAIRWSELRPALTGAGLQGGELRATEAGAADLWQSWWQGWAGAGLGQPSVAEPWWVPMSAIAWLAEHTPGVAGAAAGVATAWLLVAAIPLAALAAYAACAVGTSHRGVRAVAGLGWAGLTCLTVSLDQGRVGPVVAHVLAPLVVAGLVVAAGRGDGARRTCAAFGTALACGLAAAFAPPVLLASTAGGLLVVALARGAGRWRGVAITVLPWLMLGPWLQQVLLDPRLLGGGPGGTATGRAVEPWQMLLLHPGGGLAPTLWWTVPLWLLALGAALRQGERGTRAVALLCGALLALAAALATPYLELGLVPVGQVGAGTPVTSWPGTLLSIVGACLLLAAVQTADLVTGARVLRGWRGAVVTVLGAVTALSGVGLLGWTAWAGAGQSLAVAAPTLPAVAVEQARGPESTRTLELLPSGSTVSHRLVGREPAWWVRDRVTQLVQQEADTSQPPGTSDDAVLTSAVELLVGEGSEPGGAAAGSGALRSLHDLGVGYVVLRAQPDHALVSMLDTTAGLTRLGAESGAVWWRVGSRGTPEALVAVSRAWLEVDGVAVATVPVGGAHGQSDAVLPAGSAAGGASLVVSEPTAWTGVAEVIADGTVLQPEPGVWPPTYPLPQGDGQVSLSVDVRSPQRWWQWATGGLVLVLALLAVPVGTRRRRSR